MQGPQEVSQVISLFESARALLIAMHLAGLGCFAYIVWRRLVPLMRGERDCRFDRPWTRLTRVAQFWFGQWKHPRYPTAGILHILIFTGFILLVVRSFSTLLVGLSSNVLTPGFSGAAGHVYDVATDYAATVVFLCMLVAMVRRMVFKPARYAVPARYGKAHTADAIFLLALIALLMAADSLFIAAAAQASGGHEWLAFFSLPWAFQLVIDSASRATAANLCFGAYVLHAFAFYFLLCYRPFGIQFHVETSLFDRARHGTHPRIRRRELRHPRRWRKR